MEISKPKPAPKAISNSPMRRLAKLRKDYQWEVNYLKKGVLKNWRDESQYMALIDQSKKSQEEIVKTLAWEFLRRNLEYVNIYFSIRKYRKVLDNPSLDQYSLEMRENAYSDLACDLSYLLLFGIRFSEKRSPRSNVPPKFLDENEIRSEYPYFMVENKALKREDDKVIAKKVYSLFKGICSNPIYSKEEQKMLMKKFIYGLEYKPIAINPTVTIEFSLAHDITAQMDSASNWLRKLQDQYKHDKPYDMPKASKATPVSSVPNELCIRYLRLLDALFSVEEKKSEFSYSKREQLAEIYKVLLPEKGSSTIESNVRKALEMSQDRQYLNLIGLGHIINTPKYKKREKENP
jgi:hypothetical protein